MRLIHIRQIIMYISQRVLLICVVLDRHAYVEFILVIKLGAIKCVFGSFMWNVRNVIQKFTA